MPRLVDKVESAEIRLVSPLGRHAISVCLCVSLVWLGGSCGGTGGGSGDYCTGPDRYLSPFGSHPDHFAEASGTLFFEASSRLWMLNGKGEPERIEHLDAIHVRPANSLDPFVAFAGHLYFEGDDPARRLLWRTDGVTSAPAIRNWPPNATLPNKLTPLGDYLFFVADNGIDDGIWKVDVTGERTFVTERPDGHRFAGLGVYGDRLMVSTFTPGDELNDPDIEHFLFEIFPDGELALVADIRAEFFAQWNGELLLSGVDGLWKYDGIDPPERLMTSPIGEMRLFEDKLYFVVLTRTGFRHQLWVFDGVNPPALVLNTSGLFPEVEFIGVIGDTLFVVAEIREGSSGQGQHWIYGVDRDSTPSRVVEWPDYVVRAGEFDGKIYHRGRDDRGTEPWVFDGVHDRLLEDLEPGEQCLIDDPDDEDE